VTELSDEHRDAIREANYRRANPWECGSTSLDIRDGKEVGGMPGINYKYCGGCGWSRPMLLLIASINVAPAQTSPLEHALTREQCKADEKAWALEWQMAEESKLGMPDSLKDFKASKYDVMSDRSLEMMRCSNYFDSAPSFGTTAWALESDGTRRMRDFLERHGLWDQFLAEDAAGKR
jgi:hypothetical protein